MAEQKQIYKCKVCGNIVEVLHGGNGTLVCCGEPMELQVAKAEDAGREKHVPVIGPIPGGVRVKVGEVPHPMEEAHFIEWIEVSSDKGETAKIFLKPGDQPEVEFMISGEVAARIYCNIHGLWKSK
jgi:superoxide reductase